MAQVGFFTKKQVGEESKVAKRQSGDRKPRAAKPEPVYELPPRLLVTVPAEEKKDKPKAASSGDRPAADMDIECYVNYFLVKFRLPDGKMLAFEQVDGLGIALDAAGIRHVLDAYEITTYNGNHFDLPLLNYVLAGDRTNIDIKAACDDIFKKEMKTYKFEEKHGLNPLEADHVDLSPLCPTMTSLKLMGARLHSEVLHELPYEEDTRLSGEQMDAVCDYCGNDLAVNFLLRTEFGEDIDLRRLLGGRYGVDLRSRSDAQIAEDIFRVEGERREGRRIMRPKELYTKEFRYQIPDFISFENPRLREVLDALREDLFIARPVSKGIQPPERLDKFKAELGGMTYTMGIGGLHSTEKTAFHLADADVDLYDFDVTSYYPAIVLNSGLYPPAIGPVFLDIYREIVDERIAAKRAGDKVKADGMKITINGTFGKFGSPWSVLYAPELMIQVTLTGQLAVLMLIERLVRHGVAVVSGNTDGIVVKPRRDQEDLMRSIVRRWEHQTGFATETTHYAGLWSRDVNNYLAIGHDGKVKAKGTFGYAGRKKNPEHDVCTDALVAWLKFGTPVEETVRACRDVRKFLSVRQVNGGAMWDGKYVGKVVRWYYSTEAKGYIAYKTNGNKVPQTDGARPLPVLPAELPGDIDYDWYVRRCREMFY